MSRIGTEKVSSTAFRLLMMVLSSQLQPRLYHQPSMYAIAMAVIVTTKSVIVKVIHLC